MLRDCTLGLINRQTERLEYGSLLTAWTLCVLPEASEAPLTCGLSEFVRVGWLSFGP